MDPAVFSSFGEADGDTFNIGLALLDGLRPLYTSLLFTFGFGESDPSGVAFPLLNSSNSGLVTVALKRGHAKEAIRKIPCCRTEVISNRSETVNVESEYDLVELSTALLVGSALMCSLAFSRPIACALSNVTRREISALSEAKTGELIKKS